MSSVPPFTAETPLPEANPEELRRVWALLVRTEAEYVAEHPPGTSFGISTSLIEKECQLPGETDVRAIFFRATLLEVVRKLGLLTPWQNEAELRDVVFEEAARFPLTHGVEGFDPEALVRRLRERG